MLVTAELRLWWTRCPEEVARLFSEAPSEERADLYLLEPGQDELGVKLRDCGGSRSDLEVKLLVKRLARGEMWAKADSSALNLTSSPVAKVQKLRRQRHFRFVNGDLQATNGDGNTSGGGCDVEFTRVLAEGDPQHWWTLGFEASGAFASLEETLIQTVDLFLTEISVSPFAGAKCGGYPAWLAGTLEDCSAETWSASQGELTR